MNLQLFHKLLFSWFRKHARILPWREKIDGSRQKKSSEGIRDATSSGYFTTRWGRDPYRVAVSELMLQQTQVDRVLPKFEAFIRKWPTVHELAQATLSDVLIMWKGLGYNRRARFLHEMAMTVVHTYHGTFPSTEAELLKLPGIGRYTARAILTFAYGKDVGVIDTNIQRIFARTYFGVEQSDLHQLANISPKQLIKIVDEAVPKGKGDPWNQALMDFGATVCIAKFPRCQACPLQTVCTANLQARKNGFDSYASELREEQRTKRTITPKTNIKFEETDRFFRGRVVDKLRDGPLEMEELYDHIRNIHGLTDKLRWGQIIEGLMLDKLITIRGSLVSLP